MRIHKTYRQTTDLDVTVNATQLVFNPSGRMLDEGMGALSVSQSRFWYQGVKKMTDIQSKLDGEHAFHLEITSVKTWNFISERVELTVKVRMDQVSVDIWPVISRASLSRLTRRAT